MVKEIREMLPILNIYILQYTKFNLIEKPML